MSKSNFIFFGFGYTAKALTPKLIAQGFNVVGTTRTPSMANHGAQLINFNCPQLKESLKQATHLLISIPPQPLTNDVVLLTYGNLIKKYAPHLQWLGYLSSTGVYGDHQGAWVTEHSACIPHTATGIARLKAEEEWASFAKDHELPLHIFRLSGIYGPGRNVLERIVKGKKYSIVKENQVFCRIHVDDIVATLLASIKAPKPLSIYNVSDDEPAAPHHVDKYAAALLQREPLPLLALCEANLSPMEQEFYSSNRRVYNLKMKQELHPTLLYPSFREGLQHIWRTDFAHKSLD